MIATIFNAIETRLNANAAFDGWNFYRFSSDDNSGKQSKGSVPFIRLFWKGEESAQMPKRWQLDSGLTFGIEARWTTDESDPGSLARITEQQTKKRAIQAAIFPDPGEGEEDFLGLAYIANLRLKFAPLQIRGPEIHKQNGIEGEIWVEYFSSIT